MSNRRHWLCDRTRPGHHEEERLQVIVSVALLILIAAVLALVDLLG